MISEGKYSRNHVKVLDLISKRGYEIRRDSGITIQLKNISLVVKSSYLCSYKGRDLICIDFASPLSIEPLKRFLSAYGRIIGSPLGLILGGEKIVMFKTMSEKEVDPNNIPPPDELLEVQIVEKKFDRQIAATYYDILHCTLCQPNCCKEESDKK